MMPMMPEDENRLALKSDSYVSKEWLFNELLMERSRILVLDCRSSNEYGESHIRQAVNFSIPSMLLRRLAVGKIDLVSTIRCRELKEKIQNAYKNSIFVVYGEMIDQDRNFSSNDAIHVLIRRLQKDGCQAVCLQGTLSLLKYFLIITLSHSALTCTRTFLRLESTNYELQSFEVDNISLLSKILIMLYLNTNYIIVFQTLRVSLFLYLDVRGKLSSKFVQTSK